MNRTFEEVWAEKELQGFSYGPDALENVRLGYELGLAEMRQIVEAKEVAAHFGIWRCQKHGGHGFSSDCQVCTTTPNADITGR